MIRIPVSTTDGISHLWVTDDPSDGGAVSASLMDTTFDPVATLIPRTGSNKPRYDARDDGGSVEQGSRFFDGEQRSFALAAVGTFPITTDQGFILWCYFPDAAGPAASRDPLSKGTGTPSVTCRILSTGRAQIRHVDSGGTIVTASLPSDAVMARLVPLWYACTPSATRISVAAAARAGGAVANGAVIVAAAGDSTQPWNLGSAPAGSGPNVSILALARIVGAAAIQADDGLAMMRKLWPWRTAMVS